MKLSNFLLDETPIRKVSGANEMNEMNTLNELNEIIKTNGAIYSLPWGRYSIPAVNGKEWVVKLSDFGTAEISQSGEISVGQFTTLENTPLFCLLESKPRRGAHCDRWCLGLSLLHLLTGQIP